VADSIRILSIVNKMASTACRDKVYSVVRVRIMYLRPVMRLLNYAEEACVQGCLSPHSANSVMEGYDPSLSTLPAWVVFSYPAMVLGYRGAALAYAGCVTIAKLIHTAYSAQSAPKWATSTHGQFLPFLLALVYPIKEGRSYC
jgi:hypothetical protein